MSSVHQSILDRVLQELKHMPVIAAIAAYGSTASRQWTPESDLDLVLILNVEAPVNSVHFFVDGVPVDINLKDRDRWTDGDLGWLPPNGVEAVWDPGRLFEDVLPPPSATSDAEQYRYAHRHRLHKLQKWIRQDADIADLLAAGATHWIAVSYFHARGMRFPGIDQAVFYWRTHEPQMVDLLVGAAMEREDRLKRVKRASEIALSPVGGLWSANEIYLTGWNGPPTTDETRRAKVLLEPIFSLADEQ